MNLINVLLDKQFKLTLLENNKTDNIIFCKPFEDTLHNLCSYTTKNEDFIYRYVLEDDERFIITDILLEDGTLYKKVKFKLVTINENEVPYSVINFKSLTSGEKANKPVPTKPIIVKEHTVPVPKYDTREDINKVKLLEQELLKERTRIENEKKILSKQKLLVDNQNTIQSTIESFKEELIQEFHNISQRQESLFQGEVSSNVTKINEQLNNYIKEYESQIIELFKKTKTDQNNTIDKQFTQLNENLNNKLKDNKKEFISLIETVRGKNLLEIKEQASLVQDTFDKTVKKLQTDVLLELKESLETNIQERKQELEALIENKSDDYIIKVVEKADELKSLFDEKLATDLQQYKEKLIIEMVDIGRKFTHEFLEEGKIQTREEIKSHIKTEQDSLQQSFDQNVLDLKAVLEKATQQIDNHVPFVEEKIKLVQEKINELDKRGNLLREAKENILLDSKKYTDTKVSQAAEEARNYARRILDLGGGGGSVAGQFTDGGAMNGDLNVNGNYLSGGVNLLDIFALQPDLDNQTLSYNDSNYDLSISNGNTVNLSAINSTFNANSGKYESVYTVASSNSAYWSEAYTNLTSNSAAYLSGVDISLLAAASGSWNSNYTTVSQNSAYWADTRNNVTFEKNVTIQGNLTALGTSTFKNTVFTTTSALSVVNLGPGPALYVYQASGPSDVASFYDGDGIEVLHVGNAQGGGNPLGQVGINTSDPSAELTVNGAISSNGVITVLDGNSDQWNSVYTTVNTSSAVTIVDGGNTRGANIAVGARDAFNVALRTNNANRVWILSSGEVGIGPSLPSLVNLINSSSPNSPRLTVSGPISSNNTITVADGNSNLWNSVYTTVKSNSGSYILDGGNAKGANISIGTNDNYNLILEINGNSKLLLTSDTLSGNSNKTSFGAGSATGLYSFAEGDNSQAIGNASHAEGLFSTARGTASHAEGYNNIASGSTSHAEGDNSQAIGNASHAEGLFSTARGTASHTEGFQTSAFGTVSHAEGENTLASGYGAHAEGVGSIASGYASHAEGILTRAVGEVSHAAGGYSVAAHNRTWIWKGDTNVNTISTTRTDQFMVSAAGGVYIPGSVGIGTDNNSNALTVVGTISTNAHKTSQDWSSNYTTTNTNSARWSNWSSVSANYALGSQYVKLSGDTMTGTLSVGSGGNLFSPNFATFVKDSAYSTLSSTLINNSGYFDSQGTFASPGGFIIKGHAVDYNNSPRNLPNIGTYGLYIQNVNAFDPGTTFVSDGRAQVTHSMSFRAGINNFTGGSDHNHVQWQGSPSNSTQAWQMTNGGNATNVYGYQFPYTNRFMVHTLPQYQYNTTITAISGFIDTREANRVTGTDGVSGVKLLVSRDVGTGNYNLLNVGEVVGLTINPGLVGLVAASYNCQVTQISANAALSSFQFTAYIGNGDNWQPAQKNIQTVSLLSRTDGGNPGVSLVTSQIGTDPSTQYVGLTGSYRGINKHMLARFTSSALLTGYKTGAPLTLWIPPLMPSSSPIGTGIISSDKITTFAQGTFPTGVRSGYFDAYVVSVSGTDLEFSIGNLMDSYSFENRSWPFSASGTAGWLLYGGSQDTVHRPTFGTTGFYFEREPWNVGSVNWLSGGMVKNVVLGTSESYGNFSYGLGWRGVVLGDKSGTFAGDYNTVFGNNSVALGGEGLISLSSTSHQAVVGKYNNPNNNALFVVGAGTNNTNRTNVLEVEASKVTINGAISSNGVATVLGGNSNQWNSNYTTTQVNTAADSFDLSYTGTLPLPGLPVYTVNPLRDALLGASGSQAATLRNGKWVSSISINGYGIFTLDNLISLSSADIVGVGGGFSVANTTKLTTINFPFLATIGAGFSITNALSLLTTINFPSLVSIVTFMQINGNLNSLTTLSFPSLVSVGGGMSNTMTSTSLTAMNFPSLVTVGSGLTVFGTANSLPSITFPSLVTVGGAFSIASFGGGSANSLTSISFPSLSAITGSFVLSNGGSMNAVTSVSFPSLAIVGTNIQPTFGSMNSLTTLSFPSLVSVGGAITMTSSLTPSFTTLLIGPSLQHVNGDVTITAGRLDGHNAWSANTYYASYTSFTAPASAFSSTPTGTTCTVNIINHGLQTGDIIGVHGITGTTAAVHTFNVQGVLVTRITANQFTYSLPSATTQLPTGTATIQVQAVTVAPVTKNGRKYICTGAGTSGGTEPAWPTTIGSTVADGTATWTCSEMSLPNILSRLDALNGTNQTTTYGANRFINITPTALITISSITTTAGVATITTASNHGITTGTQVVISGCTGTALRYNGVWTVTSTGLTTLTTPVPTDLNGVAGAGTMRLTTSCPQFTGNTPISATTITGVSADSHMIAANVQLRDSDGGSFLPIFPAGIYNRNGTTNGFARYSCTENGWDIWYDTTTTRWVNSPSQFTGVTATIGNYLFTAQNVPLASTSSANPAVITSSANHGIATGAVFTVVIEGCSNAALNGSWTATSTGATTFTIPVDGSAGATTSSGTVAVLNQSFNQGRLMSGSIIAPIQGVQQTITTSVNHGFTTGDFIHFYGASGTNAASVNDLNTSSVIKSMTSAITVINATSFRYVRYASIQPFVGSYSPTTMPHMRKPSINDTAYYLALKMRSRGVAVSLAGTTGI